MSKCGHKQADMLGDVAVWPPRGGPDYNCTYLIRHKLKLTTASLPIPTPTVDSTMDRSRSPRRGEEHHEEELDAFNWDIWAYLTQALKIKAPDDVIEDTVKGLMDNQFDTPGELTVVPDEELANMFPWFSHKKHHVVVMQAKKQTIQLENPPT